MRSNVYIFAVTSVGHDLQPGQVCCAELCFSVEVVLLGIILVEFLLDKTP